MNSKNLSKLLIYLICLLPFFYNYFVILPYLFRWSIDFLILFTLFTLPKNKRIPKNKLYRYFQIYTILIIFTILFSAFYNNSNILLTIASIRKAILPFVLFYIFYHIMFIYQDEIYNDTFTKISYIQIIIVPIEYLLFLFYSNFRASLSENTPYNSYDIASGTFGAGGTGVVGVFLVIFFVYSFINLNRKYSYIFLIPLAFIFSGGANVLLIIAILFIIFFTNKKLKNKISNLFYIGLFISMILIISNLIFSGVLINNIGTAFEKYYIFSFEKKGETFGTYDQKLSRIGGFIYVNKRLNTTGNKILGLGLDAVAESRTLNVKSFKLGSITDIKSESLFRLSQSGYLGLIINYSFYLFIILYFIKRFKRNKYYLTGTIIFILFFISTFYIQSINNINLMSFISSFLAISVIYETKNNYIT